MVVCYILHSPQHLQHKASRRSEGRGSHTLAGDSWGPRYMSLNRLTIQSRPSSLQQLHRNASFTFEPLLMRMSAFKCAAVHSYLLGQSVLLQGCVSMALPVHPLPPFCGGGLLHRRTRVMFPSPHVVVHADQGDQRPQFPSARTRQIKTKESQTTATAQQRTENKTCFQLRLESLRSPFVWGFIFSPSGNCQFTVLNRTWLSQSLKEH